MDFSDLIIHVNETLEANERESLENELRKLNGVIAPRFNKETPHLLLVSYNPRKIGSGQLLSRVKAHDYNAQLIGM